MISTIWYIILTVVGFGMLVLVHEFGHFIAAKAIGAGVETFSMGLGPRLFGKKIGETDYCLSAIPWGGFVKLAGEQRDPHIKPGPRDFFGKPPGQRAIVFAAGTIMNAITGILLFILAYGVGVPSTPPIIGEITPGGPAWRAGLREGDRVVEVNRLTKHLDFGDVKSASLLSGRGKVVTFEVERNGQRHSLKITPEYSEVNGVPMIGISPKITLNVEAVFAYQGERRRIISDPNEDPLKPEERSPALEAGLLPGDLLIEANGTRLTSHRQLTDDIIANSAGEPIQIIFERDGERMQANVMPISAGPWLLGIVSRSATISAARRASWADLAGLRQGDTITAVNGVPVKAYSQAQDIIDETPEDGTLVFTLEGDNPREVEIPRARVDRLDEVLAFRQKNIISEVTPGFPAEKAGIQPGDIIIEVDGALIQEQGDMTERIRASEGAPIPVKWLRDGEEMSAMIGPERMLEMGMLFKPLDNTVQLGLWPATFIGTRKALRWIPRVFQTLEGLLTGRIASRHLGGPIGIVQLTYRSASAGPGTLLYFLGFISINLAIFNLLPIPVLDGGHLLFAGIEKVKGSPVSERAQNIASYVGLGLLLMLMVYAAWNDVIRLIFGSQFM